MKQDKFELLFSKPRIYKYLNYYYNDCDKAIELYKRNIELSESLYPLLSVTEISIRNAVNRSFINYFKSENWFENLNVFSEFQKDISNAIHNLEKRKEKTSNGKITAELTFGFWTKLFNAGYELTLWKPLRLAFGNMQKSIRKRSNISVPMNNIRIYRNRIYHYEPIVWKLEEVEILIEDCYKILDWIDSDLTDFAQSLDWSSRALIKVKEIKEEVK